MPRSPFCGEEVDFAQQWVKVRALSYTGGKGIQVDGKVGFHSF